MVPDTLKLTLVLLLFILCKWFSVCWASVDGSYVSEKIYQDANRLRQLVPGWPTSQAQTANVIPCTCPQGSGEFDIMTACHGNVIDSHAGAKIAGHPS
jgi:hypothetical protein